LFFFSNQKTPYVFSTWLEFRRVLFRSAIASNSRFDPILAAVIYRRGTIFPWIARAKPATPRGSLARARDVANCCVPHLPARVTRSEERRVGKGCRRRLLPDHVKGVSMK